MTAQPRPASASPGHRRCRGDRLRPSVLTISLVGSSMVLVATALSSPLFNFTSPPWATSPVDAATFRLLHNHVFADATTVFVGGHALPVMDADAPTFQKVAELESAGCVLFRDKSRSYIFDPASIEVYTLSPAQNGVSITKDVWFEESDGTRRRGATVSATWSDGSLSEPAIEMQRGFEGSPPPRWEIGKMQRMAGPIREAVARMREGL